LPLWCDLAFIKTHVAMHEVIFSIANTAALLGWLLLIFLPRWRGTDLVVHRGLLLVLLALAYAVLIVQGLGEASGGGFGRLAEVKQLFTSDAALLAGWLHYLAFDLFVGAWIVRDAARLGLHHGVVIAPLLLCFMLGPVGFLVYFVIRLIKTSSLRDENFA